MYKRLFTYAIILLVLLTGTSVAAQQRQQYSQYMLNRYETNSSFAGFDRSLSVTAGMRTQWENLDGAPRAQYINAHLPLYFLNGSAGMRIHSQQLGLTNIIDVSGSFNYVMELPVGIFSAGLELGIEQVNLNGDAIRTPGGVYIDGAIQHNDPLLGGGGLNQQSITWGVSGMYAHGPMEIGLAFSQVPDGQINFGTSFYNLNSHFSLYASYLVTILELMDVRPSLLIRADDQQVQTDISVVAYYNQVLGGIGLRGYSSTTIDALSIMGGLQLSPKLRLSYSYDLGLSGLRTYHDGTHEFMINYNLNKRIKTGDLPPVIYNPRYD